MKDSCQAVCVDSTHHLGMLVWKTCAKNGISLHVMYRIMKNYHHTHTIWHLFCPRPFTHLAPKFILGAICRTLEFKLKNLIFSANSSCPAPPQTYIQKTANVQTPKKNSNRAVQLPKLADILHFSLFSGIWKFNPPPCHKVHVSFGAKG
jgi:hypothetical protein